MKSISTVPAGTAAQALLFCEEALARQWYLGVGMMAHMIFKLATTSIEKNPARH